MEIRTASAPGLRLALYLRVALFSHYSQRIMKTNFHEFYVILLKECTQAMNNKIKLHILYYYVVRLQHRQLAAPMLSSMSPSGCTTTQPQHTWQLVIFCRRSYRLEFASGRAPRSRLYRKHIQAVNEVISFLAALVWTAR